ncbi:nuclear transport factor 2 family protein [Ahrensia marina]|uniref:nuclear transport factor 2 family protein n=1 Tax=Ahrensia marina TaxID=1514904 RepID=UPI0035CF562F
MVAGLPTKDASARDVAWSYWQAEIDRDVEKVLAHYHSDAVFVPNGRQLTGHAEIRTFYDESCRLYPTLEVEIVRESRGGNIVALEWSAAVTDRSNLRIPFVGVNLVTIEAGRFREVRAYFDTSVLLP